MANTIDKEVVISYVADIGGLKPVVDIQQKIGDNIRKNYEDEKAASEKATQKIISDREKLNQVFKKNIEIIKQSDKILESFRKSGEKAFDSKKIQDFAKKVKSEFERLNELSKFSIKFDDEELKILSTLVNSTNNEFGQLLIVISALQGKLDALDYKDENAKNLEKGLADLVPQAEALARLLDDVDESSEEASKSQKSLASQLRSVKEEMVQLESEGKSNTEQYEQLKNKAVQLQKSIKDVNDEIKKSASDTAGLESVIGAVNGLVGIYATAQGAAALFGEESEELEQTIQKLGGALAILNGLQATQAELANKQGLANKALTFIQRQYAIATDASAAATTRFGAALKLTGIGLLVGALAAAVVYWKDIAKWIGISSDEAERANTLNERAIEIQGEEIAKLDTLTKVIKDSNTSLEGRKNALKDLIDLSPEYLKGLTLENIETSKGVKILEDFRKKLFEVAKAKAAQQLMLEYQQKLIENELKLAQLEDEYQKRYGDGVSGAKRVRNIAIDFVLGVGSDFGLGEGDVGKQIINLTKENEDLKKSIEGITDEVIKGYDNGAFNYGDEADKTTKKATKATKDWAAEVRKLIAELVKTQEAYKVSLISNDREREIAERTLAFEEEKKHYQEQIDAIEGSGEKKLAAQRKFNEIYNTENGIAYEAFQKDITNINEKYSKQAEDVRLQALTAIREVNKKTTAIELQAIKDRWDGIRKKLRTELELTNDVVEQAKINKTIQETINAQKTEENQFRLSRENDFHLDDRK